MKKDEFMMLIKDCQIPGHFDQKLLDQSAAMMEKWGLQAHVTWTETDDEYLFKNFGLVDKSDDSETAKKEKKALRCVASKIMKTQMSKNDAMGIMKNFNSINEAGFRWLE